MSNRLLFSTRKTMIGRTIGAYLLGIGGGLLLARFFREPAIIGFILVALGIITTGIFALRHSKE